jgi:hypothetical protein
MPLSNNGDESLYYLSGNLSTNDDDVRRLHSQSPEEEEEDNYDDTGSQVTFDTFDVAGMDFPTPGGLNLFTVALPAKAEKLVAKDLPKIIKSSGIWKKNCSATIDALNVAIKQLRKMAIAENSTARSIHDVAKEALKRGTKSLDDAAKKVGKLQDELTKTKTKFADVTEKLCQAAFDRDAAAFKEETTSNTLKTTQKELGDAKKDSDDLKEELSNLKKDAESGGSSRNSCRGRSGSSNKARGDSMEQLREKECIKLDAFEMKTLIA